MQRDYSAEIKLFKTWTVYFGIFFLFLSVPIPTLGYSEPVMACCVMDGCVSLLSWLDARLSVEMMLSCEPL